MPLGGSVARLLEALGGVCGYSAKCEANGVEVALSARGIEGRSPRAVAAECAAALGLPGDAVPLGGGLLAPVGTDGEDRLLLVPDGKGGCVAWTVEGVKRGVPRNPPPERGVPFSPLAAPVFHAANRTSGATLAVGESAEPPDSLRASQGARLVAEGWEALDPGGDSGLDLYVRGGRLCLVWAGAAPEGRKSRLAVFCRGMEAP
ncbi:MAG: hypothetical protein ACOX5G_04515 [Kiritimatiellia bacterium]